ncbi:hypothetical protein O181_031421 [Austropuccinia psidii MF-1]|uniref:Glucose-6-phosphate 1-epimerase n=1 Tax=Austropuccinia psidii MF-1 TaxID=1389203 RepID=A0A9Q3D0F7_9BASI|nr:hypothetical protein [Austropuccinia psidii MF-1]
MSTHGLAQLPADDHLAPKTAFKVLQSTVLLSTENSTLEIAFHGAHIVSWIVRNVQQLFLSSASSVHGPAPIRGGIPICFPVFGPPPSKDPFLKLNQHGFARNLPWTFDGVQQSQDSINARFILNSSNPQVQKIFQPAFECLYTIKLNHSTLTTSLKVTNPAHSNLQFQALFHTYLRLPPQSQPSDVRLKPLKGLSYTDKVLGGKTFTEERDQVDFLAGEVDRVYNHVPNQIEIDFASQKKILLTTSSLPNLTVWNPHQIKSDAMADMEKEGSQTLTVQSIKNC